MVHYFFFFLDPLETSWPPSLCTRLQLQSGFLYLDTVSDDKDQGLGEEESKEAIVQVGVRSTLKDGNHGYYRQWQEEREDLHTKKKDGGVNGRHALALFRFLPTPPCQRGISPYKSMKNKNQRKIE